MTTVRSECCEFHLGSLPAAEAYCYVCGTVHTHEHLDLRHLRATFLGKVVRRHDINWGEISKDDIKFNGMKRGTFCQSILTEIEAMCPHAKPLHLGDAPLRLHMCYGADAPEKQPNDTVDESVAQGLDFTTDICSRGCGAHESAPGLDEVASALEQAAGRFQVGDVVRYLPDFVSFELVGKVG